MFVDPLAEKTMTPYQYVTNNPIMFTDPTGMEQDGIENEYTRYIKNGVVQEVKQTGTDGGDIYDKITDVDLDRPIMEVGTTFIVPVERSESIVATNLRSKDGASAGTYREPGFKHDYKYKAQSQAIEPMGLDSPFFVIGGVASKVLRSKSASSGVTSTLQKHVTRAANEVDELGDAAFTVKQLQAIQRNPNLRAMYRGNRIDVRARGYITNDPTLKHLKSNYTNGADFVNPRTGQWWDMTTPAQWQKHVDKYGNGGTILKTQ